MLRNFLIPLLLLTTSLNISAQSLDAKTEKKIDKLIKKMTLREKVGQLNQYAIGVEMTGPEAKEGQTKIRYDRLLNGEVGSVLNLLGAENTYKLQKSVVEESRLGIPLLFAYDVIHGYQTIFPIPLGESSSWDLEAIELSSRIAAKESAAAGLHWTFAPMVDVSPDARWGRVMEGAGEDPYLGTEIALARTKGFQGDDLSASNTIAACAKHFAGYGYVMSGMDYNTVNIGRNALFNEILPPFKALSDAGIATFMNSFNEIDGVPASSDSYLQRDLLKGDWNYNGAVVSDWNSIGELINHGVAADKMDAGRLALNAGSDMDMEGDVYIETLEAHVESGQVSIVNIDDAVRRVLRLKHRMGLFDDPYKYSNVETEKQILGHADHMAASRDVARKSIVLLKNEGNLLPLDTKGKIAVIGPLAKDKDSPIGNWRAQGPANSAVSLWEGLEAALGESNELGYAEGCKLSIGPNMFHLQVEIEKEDTTGFAEAVALAKTSETVIMVLGETAYMSGEGRGRSDITLPGVQLDLLKAVHAVNPNIILVLMNGRPLALPWEAENIPAILETWHLGSQAGHAIADVMTGAYNPSGKLPMTFPRSVGQLPMTYNYKVSGRPSTAPDMVFYVHHNDIDKTPLFPFGHGLSYTQFDYSEVIINGNTASVTVTNSGDHAGEEVVQLYIRDVVSTVTRPNRELKGFEKISLAKGESKTVVFPLTEKVLGYYDARLDFVVEPGKFEIMIGGNSQDVKKAEFLAAPKN